MSVDLDHQPMSFGDRNVHRPQPPPPPTPQSQTETQAQARLDEQQQPSPPSPTITPTSSDFPDVVFHTPTTHSSGGHHHRTTSESSTWSTPRYAEDFSLFNATPGNLQAYQPQTPYAPVFAPHPFTATTSNTTIAPANSATAGGARRPFPTDALRPLADPAFASRFSVPRNISLEPVGPGRGGLPSTTATASTAVRDITPSATDAASQPSPPVSAGLPDQRSKKRARKRNTAAAAPTPPAQTATPPPSSNKGGRKLAPEAAMGNNDTSANDGGGGGSGGGDAHEQQQQQQQAFAQGGGMAGSNQHPDLSLFISNNGTDLFSYPMSAPVTAPDTFWGSGVPALTAMDVDFASLSSTLYQTQSAADSAMSFEWAAASSAFPQQPPALQPLSRARKPRAKKARALAPKGSEPPPMTAGVDHLGQPPLFSPNENQPFPNINPGLVFGRSASIDSTIGNPFGVSSSNLMQAPPIPRINSRSPSLPAAAAAGRGGGGAGAGAAPRRSATTIQALTAPGAGRPRPGSPVKGGTCLGVSRSLTNPAHHAKASLAAVASADASQQSGVLHAPPPPSRPASALATGRRSPLKMGEDGQSGFFAPTATEQVKLQLRVDESGKASLIAVPDQAPSMIGSQRLHDSPAQELDDWDDDESSSDDEPIIIPSRCTSFVIPDNLHASTSFLGRSHTPNSISYSDHRPSSSSMHSEAETVMHEDQCDAASELARMMETRQKQPAYKLSQGPKFGHVNPTTPSGRSKAARVRCVCHKTETRGYFMVQCKHCDMWLHGSCIGQARDTHTPMYICAFCANTPLVRTGPTPARRGVGSASLVTPGSGGTIRGGLSVGPSPGLGASPLAHKSSFKTFR